MISAHYKYHVHSSRLLLAVQPLKIERVQQCTAFAVIVSCNMTKEIAIGKNLIEKMLTNHWHFTIKE